MGVFIVVSGHGLIQERKIGSDEVFEFEVSGEKSKLYICFQDTLIISLICQIQKI